MRVALPPGMSSRSPITSALAIAGALVMLALGASGCDALIAGSPPLPTAVPAILTPTPTLVAPTPTSRPPVLEPAGLSQRALDKQDLAPGGWVGNGVSLGVQVAGGTDLPLVPEVEAVRLVEAFRGVPTDRGTAVMPGTSAIVDLKGLAPGDYRWRARLVEPSTGRTGPWRSFPTVDDAPAFRVVGGRPALKALAFAGAKRSDSGAALVGASGKLDLSWQVAADRPEAIDRLVFLRESPSGTPAEIRTLDPAARALALVDLPDGEWRLHLWTVDRAGRTGEPTTLAVGVSRAPPAVQELHYRLFATNPRFASARIRFFVSRPADVVVTVFGAGGQAPRRVYDLGRQPSDREVVVDWDGRSDAGLYVEPGNYDFEIAATDAAGNQTRERHAGLAITDRLIRVSLTRQDLVATAGGAVFLTTLVTTGGQELPTKPGNFEIEAKRSPFTFESPFPRGSRYWYPPATVRWAMLFDPAEGNFLHDKSSRAVYGPGTNGPGLPGGTYSGSHGCVNVPPGAIARLFEWAPLGTPVIVEP